MWRARDRGARAQAQLHFGALCTTTASRSRRLGAASCGGRVVLLQPLSHQRLRAAVYPSRGFLAAPSIRGAAPARRRRGASGRGHTLRLRR